jgi:hypothetical protein
MVVTSSVGKSIDFSKDQSWLIGHSLGRQSAVPCQKTSAETLCTCSASIQEALGSNLGADINFVE